MISQKPTIENCKEIVQSGKNNYFSNSITKTSETLKKQCENAQPKIRNPNYKKKLITLDRVNKIVKEKGGKLLSEEYISAKTKLDLVCANRHKFKMSWAVVKRGSWCPECATSTGEKICREYFEKIFDCEFPKSYPKWLISDKGFQLELDGYSESNAIAFEHHGRQHYTMDTKFYEQKSEFTHRLKLDIEKENLCINYGVKLIKVPEIPCLLPTAEVFSFLKNELKKTGLEIVKNEDELNINWEKIFTPFQNDKFVQIQKMAKSKNGECLSKGYLHNRQKMKFRCEYGHEWEALPASIIAQGTWCPVCACNKRKKIKNRHSLNGKNK
jgi:hypothetical protein